MLGLFQHILGVLARGGLGLGHVHVDQLGLPLGNGQPWLTDAQVDPSKAFDIANELMYYVDTEVKILDDDIKYLNQEELKELFQ